MQLIVGNSFIQCIEDGFEIFNAAISEGIHNLLFFFWRQFTDRAQAINIQRASGFEGILQITHFRHKSIAIPKRKGDCNDQGKMAFSFNPRDHIAQKTEVNYCHYCPKFRPQDKYVIIIPVRFRMELGLERDKLWFRRMGLY